MAFTAPDGRPGSIWNRCEIEVFDDVLVSSHCFFEPVGKGILVIGLSQISSFSVNIEILRVGEFFAFIEILLFCKISPARK